MRRIRMTRRFSVVIVLLLALVVTTSALAANGPFVGDSKEEYYMVTFVSGIEYWKGCFAGMEDAAKLLGTKAIYTVRPGRCEPTGYRTGTSHSQTTGGDSNNLQQSRRVKAPSI